MPKVVVTAQVEDSVKFEAAFRTHADLFRNVLAVTAPVYFAINEGNEIAVYAEPDNLDTFMKGMEGPATAEAMTQDGVPGWRQAGDRQGVCVGQGVQGLAEYHSDEELRARVPTGR